MSAFNGSGTFVISGVGLPFVTGTTISSTVANQLNTDLATGLTNCITKDGQSVPTADIPFGGFKLTGVALATATGDALSYGRAANVSALTVNGVLSAFTNTGTGNAQTAAGSTTLPGGLIIKWGYVLAATAPGATVTFSTPFPTAIIATWASTAESGAVTIQASAYPSSASQMGVVTSGGAGAFNVAWIAIGY